MDSSDIQILWSGFLLFGIKIYTHSIHGSTVPVQTNPEPCGLSTLQVSLAFTPSSTPAVSSKPEASTYSQSESYSCLQGLCYGNTTTCFIQEKHEQINETCVPATSETCYHTVHAQGAQLLHNLGCSSHCPDWIKLGLRSPFKSERCRGELCNNISYDATASLAASDTTILLFSSTTVPYYDVEEYPRSDSDSMTTWRNTLASSSEYDMKIGGETIILSLMMFCLT